MRTKFLANLENFDAEPAHGLARERYQESLLLAENVELGAKEASLALWSNFRALLRKKAAILSEIVASAHRFLKYASLASTNLMYSRSSAAWASALTPKVSTWSRSLHPLSSLTCVTRGWMELDFMLIGIRVYVS